MTKFKAKVSLAVTIQHQFGAASLGDAMEKAKGFGLGDLVKIKGEYFSKGLKIELLGVELVPEEDRASGS